jgi:Tfp pilus assembly protein PilO
MKPRFSRGTTIGLIIGGDILLLVLGWLLLIGPQRATATSIARSAQSTEVQIQALEQSAAAAETPAPKQPVIQTAGLYGLAKAMPSTTDMPDVLLELDQIARASGVTVVSIAPGTPAAGVGFNVLPITVTFSGNFYSLTDLLYRLRTLVTVRHGELDATGRLFSVYSVSLNPGGNGNVLNATATINTFVYAGAGTDSTTTTPGATPATTTSTDTTTTTGP